MDTLYKGIRTTEGGPQLVQKDGKVVLDPTPSQKLYNHSPDGFQWGFGGSGPAQLALALLLDVSNNPELSIRLHQTFKSRFVAAFGEKWQMRRSHILLWIEENK